MWILLFIHMSWLKNISLPGFGKVHRANFKSISNQGLKISKFKGGGGI
jgi:hypothetical protein